MPLIVKARLVRHYSLLLFIICYFFVYIFIISSSICRTFGSSWCWSWHWHCWIVWLLMSCFLFCCAAGWLELNCPMGINKVVLNLNLNFAFSHSHMLCALTWLFPLLTHISSWHLLLAMEMWDKEIRGRDTRTKELYLLHSKSWITAAFIRSSGKGCTASPPPCNLPR